MITDDIRKPYIKIYYGFKGEVALGDSGQRALQIDFARSRNVHVSHLYLHIYVGLILRTSYSYVRVFQTIVWDNFDIHGNEG